MTMKYHEWLDVLKLPDQCKVDLNENEVILLVPKDWCRELIAGCGRIPDFCFDDFPVQPEVVQCAVRERRAINPYWQLLNVEFITKQPGQPCSVHARDFSAALIGSLSRESARSQNGNGAQTYSTLLRQVAHENLATSWRHCRQKYTHAVDAGLSFTEKDTSDSGVTSYDDVIRDFLRRTYKLEVYPVVEVCDSLDNNETSATENEEPPGSLDGCNLSSALSILETDSGFLVVSRAADYQLSHCADFCSTSLTNNSAKLMLVGYQLLRAVRDLHNRGVPLNLARADDVAADQLLWLRVRPRLSNLSLLGSESSDVESTNVEPNHRSKLPRQEDGNDNSLHAATEAWAVGRISNLDYLMCVNACAGRRMNDPAHHVVVPWVTDMSESDGRQWRPLFRSKYRLNKGDEQLRQQYSTAAASGLPAYHVSDVLSEITYYVYTARRTPRSVLCQHVRSRWVPAEYPGSMSRLYEWTPDECIPQFYTDPSIFQSVHPELPDLVLPDWAESSEHFIECHRRCLESSHVSSQIHHWIDLNFGYKLVGQAAVDSMNVCRHLCERNDKLRRSGIVQVFSRPHPRRLPSPHPLSSWYSLVAGSLPDSDVRVLASTSESRNESRSDSSGVDLAEEVALNNGTIKIPIFCDLLADLRLVESLNGVTESAITKQSRDSVYNTQQLSRDLQTQKIRDISVCICLLVEVAQPMEFRKLSISSSRSTPTLSLRLETALSALSSHLAPLSLKNMVPLLERLLEFERDVSARASESEEYPIIPSISLNSLLEPCTSPFPFPQNIAAIYRAMAQFEVCRVHHQRAVSQHGLESTEELDAAEVWATTFCRYSVPLLPHLSSEWLQLVTARFLRLLKLPRAAAVVTWQLFSPLAQQLSRAENLQLFLKPILAVFQPESIGYKSVKLFHRTMLSHLIARFGHAVFLQRFSSVLVDAVGGDMTDKPADWSDQTTPTQKLHQSDVNGRSELCMFTMDELDNGQEQMGGATDKMARAESSMAPPLDNANSNESSTEEDVQYSSQVSAVAADSVVWLAHRVGPLLTCQHMVYNLIRTVSLCYSRPHAFSPSQQSLSNSDSDIYITHRCGDTSAANLFVCLSGIARLYGDSVIVCHYLPQVNQVCRWVAAAAESGLKFGAASDLEPSLMAVPTLLLHLFPLLVDTCLVELLPSVVSECMTPCLRLLVDTTFHLPSGTNTRPALVQRWVCLVVMAIARLGLEMSAQLLSEVVAILVTAFARFSPENTCTNMQSTSTKTVLVEMREVFSDRLADILYRSTCHLLVKLSTTVCSVSDVQLIRLMSARYRRSSPDSTPECSTVAAPMPVMEGATMPGMGNRMVLQTGGISERMSVVTATDTTGAGNNSNNNHGSNKIKPILANGTRHLRGAWLCYWRSELTPLETGWSPRQICLQSFEGHTAAIKQMFVLDSENSFISASRDRTVKLWSIRNQGDGSHRSSAQWTYSQHRKPLCDVTYLSTNQRVVSCDSHQTHVWDPFIGVTDRVIEQIGTIQGVCQVAPDSQFLLIATSECSLKMLDLRTPGIAGEWKSWPSAYWPGRVTCVTSSIASGNPAGRQWVAVGHTYGGLSVLDMRCGRVNASWRSGESEILSMACIPNWSAEGHSDDPVAVSGHQPTALVSYSADSPLTVWSTVDGKPTGRLRGVSEPVHSLLCPGWELLSSCSSGRLYVHSFSRTHCSDATIGLSTNKLSTTHFKGGLTSLALLNMNRLLLVASDTGSIKLMY